MMFDRHKIIEFFFVSVLRNIGMYSFKYLGITNEEGEPWWI